MSLVRSRYNFFAMDEEGGVAIFNARVGSLLRLEGADSVALAENLVKSVAVFDASDVPSTLLTELVRNNFLVDSAFDELTAIRKRFQDAREDTPLVLTITTTMDCNLGCYYCYESRTKEQLNFEDISSLVAFTRERIASSSKRSLHVDWYGGEPFLNVEFLEAASFALQKLCEELGARFVSSVISNGTKWTADIAGFVRAHRVRQVQISFDGLDVNHNKRRHYRKKYIEAITSFDSAVQVVDALVNVCRVDIRFNVDRRNISDLLPFIEMCADRGWFDAPHPAVFQPARISAYTKKSEFLRAHELTLSEFDNLRGSVRRALKGRAKVEESEVPDGFPRPKTSVCAALSNSSRVVGADGLIYRCGLQVGEKHRSVGSLTGDPKSYPAQPNDQTWWKAFDPTTLPTCSKCSFLPICWGGCPKKQLERDDAAIARQSEYWRTNLPRLIATKAGLKNVVKPLLDETDQFRN